MKMRCLVFCLFGFPMIAAAAEVMPPCTDGGTYDAEIVCDTVRTEEGDRVISSCDFVEIEIFRVPVFDKLHEIKGENGGRFLCLSSKPGPVGNYGYQNKETQGKGPGNQTMHCNFAKSFIGKEGDPDFPLRITLPDSFFYSYGKLGRRVALEPGVYRIYAHLADYDFGSNGEEYVIPWDAGLFGYCDDVEPITLNVSYTLRSSD